MTLFDFLAITTSQLVHLPEAEFDSVLEEFRGANPYLEIDQPMKLQMLSLTRMILPGLTPSRLPVHFFRKTMQPGRLQMISSDTLKLFAESKELCSLFRVSLNINFPCKSLDLVRFQ
jgi:hypothetical protein